ncbi:MAG TPA: Spy/CpxP family protein refolding chaperone [Bacteroidota bacterium]|nr:Spy/CpxP family protein refolding chaperone [Bacteroidota bacterium]
MKFISGMLIALICICGNFALAQPAEGHGPMNRRGAGGGEFMERLKLTDAQKADMMKLRSSMEKSMIEVQAKIKLARVDLRALVAADSPDRSTIENKIKEINDLQFQSKKVMVDHLFDAYNLLTPDQRKTFKEHMMRNLMGPWRPMAGARRGMGTMHAPMGGEHGEQ